MEHLGPMSEAMHVPSVRRTVALVCAVAALASLIAAAPAAGRGSPNTAALQVALKALHHYEGGVDGINGRTTKRAVRRFQKAHRIPVDGVAGPRTRRKLGARGRPALGSRAMTRGNRGWDVAGLQWLLRKRGFRPNGTDGGFGANTEAAVRRAQSKYGLGVDGVAGSATVGALKRGRGPARTAQTSGGDVGGPIRFLRPVHAPVTSPFGMRWGRMHTGIDFGAVSGTAVGAGGRGVVSFAGWNAGGYGNLVVIDHRRGFQTWYAHLSTVMVSAGQAVSAGARIGLVGATGHVTGPHLHFEVRRSGTPVDPAPYLLNSYAKRVAPDHEHEDGDAPAPLDGCVPPGLPDADAASARLIDCG